MGSVKMTSPLPGEISKEGKSWLAKALLQIARLLQ